MDFSLDQCLELVGNALSFIVLRCDDDVKHATSWLLRALAVVDAFYLVTCVLIQPNTAIMSSPPITGLLVGREGNWNVCRRTGRASRAV